MPLLLGQSGRRTSQTAHEDPGSVSNGRSLDGWRLQRHTARGGASNRRHTFGSACAAFLVLTAGTAEPRRASPGTLTIGLRWVHSAHVHAYMRIDAHVSVQEGALWCSWASGGARSSTSWNPTIAPRWGILRSDSAYRSPRSGATSSCCPRMVWSSAPMVVCCLQAASNPRSARKRL